MKIHLTYLACLALLASACRHPAPKPVQRQIVLTGNSATKVMIVPSTAAWAMRPGATNRLPAGITSAKPFPFPLYDQALIRSIYDRWHALLAAQPQPEANGRVFVDFDLHADGTISRLNLLPSPVSPRLERLCVQAVADSAPFAKWSPDMLAEVGADFRGIRIAFDFEGSTNASASGPANVTRAP